MLLLEILAIFSAVADQSDRVLRRVGLTCECSCDGKYGTGMLLCDNQEILSLIIKLILLLIIRSFLITQL